MDAIQGKQKNILKKCFSLFLAVFCVLAIVACTAKEPVEDSSEKDNPDYPNTEQADWGITLSAEKITPTGITLVCSQSGGKPTGELQCGSDYLLSVYSNDCWNAVPYLLDEIAWTSEAYLIPMNDSITFDLEWEWLYGSLPAGTYRIEKSFMDFRETGDYDTGTYYAEFEIAE